MCFCKPWLCHEPASTHSAAYTANAVKSLGLATNLPLYPRHTANNATCDSAGPCRATNPRLSTAPRGICCTWPQKTQPCHKSACIHSTVWKTRRVPLQTQTVPRTSIRHKARTSAAEEAGAKDNAAAAITSSPTAPNNEKHETYLDERRNPHNAAGQRSRRR